MSIASGLVKIAGYRLKPSKEGTMPSAPENPARLEKLREAFSPLEKSLAKMQKDMDSSNKTADEYMVELTKLVDKYQIICSTYSVKPEESAVLVPLYTKFFKS